MFKKMSLAVLAASVFFASCKKELTNGDASKGAFDRSTSASVDIDPRDFSSQPTATIPATITGTTVLTAGTTWLLDGPTFVSSTGRLEIEPGVLIKGVANPSRGNSSYLVVTPGGVIDADGESASTSIVFTSDQVGSATPGDWGGIIILGNAQTNNYPAAIEGVNANEVPSGYSVTYGSSGTSGNSSSSGILRYVRIEYAGRDLDGNGNEINGLTLGGVGSGTTLSHIQVSYGLDDGFEFFGGTVSADHLISYGVADDNFDFDNGYTGTINYAVSLVVPDASLVTFTADPNGIESDNNSSGSSATPNTRPVLRNFTILGAGSRFTPILYGNRWRRNSSLDIQNSIIVGYDEAAVFFDGTGTQTHLNTASDGIFANNYIHGYGAFILPASTSWTGVTGNTNTTANPGLANPYIIGNPDFRYTNSALAGIGAFGASGSSRWDDNWASYDPSLNSY